MPHCLAPAAAKDLPGRQHGFTIVELLTITAIIGVIAAIAYPNYTKYVDRATRSDGQAGLLGAASDLERHYSKNYSYSGFTLKDSRSPEDNYTLTLDLSDPSGYLLTATTTQSDGCTKPLTIDAKGEKKPAACWGGGGK